MDAYRMINLLGYRLQDTSSSLFTDSFKIKAINNGIIKLVQAIHSSYLTELQVIKSNMSLTTGYANLSSTNLGYLPLRGGQGILKVKDYTTGIYCLQIGIDEFKKIENTYLSPATNHPMFYIFRNRLYVLPATITAVDVHFIKIPTEIIYKFIGTTSGGGATLTAAGNQGLIYQTNDVYNGFPLFSEYDSKYSVVTDYVGATRVFTLSPVVTDSMTSKYFYLMKNDFDPLNNRNIAPEINPAIEEIAISLAESYCWTMDNNVDRSKIAFDQAMSEIELLNSRYTEAEGIGTGKRR